MSNADPAAETRRTRRLRRFALIAGIVLVILILFGVGVYAIAFLILAPMMA